MLKDSSTIMHSSFNDIFHIYKMLHFVKNNRINFFEGRITLKKIALTVYLIDFILSPKLGLSHSHNKFKRRMKCSYDL